MRHRTRGRSRRECRASSSMSCRLSARRVSALQQGLTIVHFSPQPKPCFSHLPVSPCLIDWGEIMHPSYATKRAYGEPKSGRDQAPDLQWSGRGSGTPACRVTTITLAVSWKGICLNKRGEGWVSEVVNDAASVMHRSQRLRSPRHGMAFTSIDEGWASKVMNDAARIAMSWDGNDIYLDKRGWGFKSGE